MNAHEVTILEISRHELGSLSNALNEVCNGIEVLDFETKIGLSTEEANGILDFFCSTYQQALQNERLGNTENKIVLELTRRELCGLINTITVVCFEIEAWEFETRLGITIEEAKTMLCFLKIALESC